MMDKIEVGCIVDVTVERVLSFGVFVSLQNGTKGYIRGRELDLDADIAPAAVVREGDQFRALVVADEGGGKNLELSRRAILPDPWAEFVLRCREGDAVTATVQALHPDGVFVRIAPGIRGFIPLSELALWPVTRPDDLFWIGDEVQAVIMELIKNIKRVRLSIRARLEQRDRAMKIIDSIEKRAPVAVSQASTRGIHVAANDYTSPTARDPDALGRASPILVVEDHEDLRVPLVEWLRGLGYHVDEAESSAKALDHLAHRRYRTLLLDMNLMGDDGLGLAHYVRERDGRMKIGLMSGFNLLQERANDIQSAGVAEVFLKPLDLASIEAFLLRGTDNQSRSLQHSSLDNEKMTLSTFTTPAKSNFVRELPAERLHKTLSDTATELQAETALLFELDPMSQGIVIRVHAGTLKLEEEALYGLLDSPVADVLRTGESIAENRVKERARTRFNKLLDLLDFNSCIGVPIRVREVGRHVAFFFHRKPNAFAYSDVRIARSAAFLLAAILEDEKTSERLESLNPLLLYGELAAGIQHEINNKITGLELRLRNLLAALEKEPVQPAAIGTLLKLTLDMRHTIDTFQELLQTSDNKASLNVNEIVQVATHLLRPVANKEGVSLLVKLSPVLPPVRARRIPLQQAFLNIMLNAVQHLVLKAKQFRWDARRILEISTSWDEHARLIQVRFTDNGPGIHRQLWEPIFMPGFSQRGGSGLGLFLARNFLHALGGTVQIEESYVPFGTTFLVELLSTTEEINQ